MDGRAGGVSWPWLLAGVALLGLTGLIATGKDRLDTMRITAQQTARTALDSQNMLGPVVEVRDGTIVVTGTAANQDEKRAICGTVTDSLRAAQMLGTPGVIAHVACEITAPGDATTAGGGEAGAGPGTGATGTSAGTGTDAGAAAGGAAGTAAGTATGAGAGAGAVTEAAALSCQEQLAALSATERVTFALNGNEITGGKAMLDQIAEVAKGCSQFTIEVGGHTDRRGGDAINVPLSQKRAEAVRQYLIDRGVDPARLTARGYGASRPVDPSATADDEPRNRRTEFTITALN